MARRKKRVPTRLILAVLLVCLITAGFFFWIKIFEPVDIPPATTSLEAAESCETKITKILIDETLAFKFKSTEEISFSELEINSWLHNNLNKGRLSSINVKLGNNRITFSGRFSPFSKPPRGKEPGKSQLEQTRNAKIAFRVITVPKIRADRIFFEPEEIVLGRLYVPPILMPNFLETLELNPFEKESRIIKSIRVADGSLFVTVFID
jgi:hypothetical protein